MKNTNRSYYDEEVDILMLSKGKKVKHSIDCDPFIVDVGFSGAITGVEILDASQTLKLDADLLKTLKEGSMRINYHQNEAKIFIILIFENKEKEIEVPIRVSLDKEHARTEKLTFALA